MVTSVRWLEQEWWLKGTLALYIMLSVFEKKIVKYYEKMLNDFWVIKIWMCFVTSKTYLCLTFQNKYREQNNRESFKHLDSFVLESLTKSGSCHDWRKELPSVCFMSMIRLVGLFCHAPTLTCQDHRISQHYRET